MKVLNENDRAARVSLRLSFQFPTNSFLTPYSAISSLESVLRVSYLLPDNISDTETHETLPIISTLDYLTTKYHGHVTAAIGNFKNPNIGELGLNSKVDRGLVKIDWGATILKMILCGGQIIKESE